jgi:hypothetical protein
MPEATQDHDQAETLKVEVIIPGHEPRTTTELFRRSRAQLLAECPWCAICGATAEESGHPLEAHHHPIERSLANMVDWGRFADDAKRGLWGDKAAAFDWSAFHPDQWETFVDDMTVNGLMLCKAHHTGGDEGIHALPFPLWIAQRYGREGYRFSAVEIIHHHDEADHAQKTA